MMNATRGLLVLSALACAVTLSAQTADEVVSKSLAAVGGKDAMAQVKSISMETSVAVMGNDIPSTTVIVNGVGAKNETEFNGAKIVQCLTDKGGWMINPMAGVNDPTPMPDEQYKTSKDDIYIGGGLFDYADRGNKIELVSKDGGVYKVKVTSKDNAESTYLIDGTTYLVKSMTRKGNFQGQDIDMTTSYSDYRKTDVGYLMPYTMDVDFGGNFSMSIAVKKVELNKPVDPAIFEMPKAAAPAPTPAPAATTTPAPQK